jgi:hypothetical protein
MLYQQKKRAKKEPPFTSSHVLTRVPLRFMMIFKAAAQLPGLIRTAIGGMRHGRLNQVTQALKQEGIKPKAALKFLQTYGKHIDPKDPLGSLTRLWQQRGAIANDLKNLSPDKKSPLVAAKALAKAGYKAYDNGLADIALKNMNPTSTDWLVTGVGLSMAGTFLAVKGGSTALSMMKPATATSLNRTMQGTVTQTTISPANNKPTNTPLNNHQTSERFSSNTSTNPTKQASQTTPKPQPEYLKPPSEWRLPLLASKIT